MPIAFDAQVSNSDFGAGPATWSHVCTGANRLLLVGIVGDVTGVDTVGTNIPTYGGSAMTQISKLLTGQNNYIYFYYIKAPLSGTNTVSVGYSGNFIRANSASYTGLLQTGTTDAVITNTASNSPISGTLTTVADSCWLFLVQHAQNGADAAGAGATLRTGNGLSGNIYDSNAAFSPPGNGTMTITSAGGQQGIIMASFAPAASTGGQTLDLTSKNW